jgi:hypothetical protein|tara:strand:+ start:7587 stop:7784 length:198 start_codon:yes stop_codon:yes gene_type:complete
MNEYKVTYHDEFCIKLSTIVDAVTVDAAIARVRYMYDDLRMILDVEEVTSMILGSNGEALVNGKM